MLEICNPCSVEDITIYPIPCRKILATRKGGVSNLLLLKCDLGIIDLTNPAEWTTLKSTNKLIVSPNGIGEIQDAETTEDEIDCSPAVVVDEISSITFMTKVFDNVTYLDFDFENDIKNLYNAYTFMYIGCDGLLYYSRNWVTTKNPGFFGWTPKVNRTSVKGSLQTLKIDIKFNTYNSPVKGIKLPQSVIDAIFA